MHNLIIMHDFSIEYLRKYTNSSNESYLGGLDNDNIRTNFEISPKKFLEFAKYDFESKYPHHLENTVSNIKRAFHCQIDSLFYGFGLFNIEKHRVQNCVKKRYTYVSFPNKFKLLKDIGIVTPDIFKRINHTRNLFEHQYKKPKNSNEVRDAIDVTEIFIEYTDKFLVNAMVGCTIINDVQDESFEVKLDYESGKIMFCCIGLEGDKEILQRIDKDLEDDKIDSLRIQKELKENRLKIDIHKIQKEIVSEQEEYLDYLKWFISLYKL